MVLPRFAWTFSRSARACAVFRASSRRATSARRTSCVPSCSSPVTYAGEVRPLARGDATDGEVLRPLLRVGRAQRADELEARLRRLDPVVEGAVLVLQPLEPLLHRAGLAGDRLLRRHPLDGDAEDARPGGSLALDPDRVVVELVREAVEDEPRGAAGQLDAGEARDARAGSVHGHAVDARRSLHRRGGEREGGKDEGNEGEQAHGGSPPSHDARLEKKVYRGDLDVDLAVDLDLDLDVDLDVDLDFDFDFDFDPAPSRPRPPSSPPFPSPAPPPSPSSPPFPSPAPPPSPSPSSSSAAASPASRAPSRARRAAGRPPRCSGDGRRARARRARAGR